MADSTLIEWTDATWQILTGCSVLSAGCKHCYAMRLAGSRLQHHPSREGLTIQTKAGPVWNGKVRFNEQWLDQPLRWRRPRTIFVCAHSDIFHEAVADATLHRIWAVMALAGHHTMQVLTKRSERMVEFTRAIADDPAPVIDLLDQLKPSSLWNGSAYTARQSLEVAGRLPNVWMGVSTEDQQNANQRVPDLLRAAVAHRFVSAEPLLGPIRFDHIETMAFRGAEGVNALTGELEGFLGDPVGHINNRIDWIITGGESGPDARPMHPHWPQHIQLQCERYGTMFMHKQNGAWGEVETDPEQWKEKPATNLRRGRITMYPSGEYKGRGFFPVHARGVVQLDRMSKKQSGRLLNGVLYNDMPQKEVA